jgi:hypothetical protein
MAVLVSIEYSEIRQCILGISSNVSEGPAAFIFMIDAVSSPKTVVPLNQPTHCHIGIRVITSHLMSHHCFLVLYSGILDTIVLCFTLRNFIEGSAGIGNCDPLCG